MRGYEADWIRSALIWPPVGSALKLKYKMFIKRIALEITNERVKLQRGRGELLFFVRWILSPSFLVLITFSVHHGCWWIPMCHQDNTKKSESMLNRFTAKVFLLITEVSMLRFESLYPMNRKGLLKYFDNYYLVMTNTRKLVWIGLEFPKTHEKTWIWTGLFWKKLFMYKNWDLSTTNHNSFNDHFLKIFSSLSAFFCPREIQVFSL